MLKYSTPDEYLFDLQTCRPSEAKREWRKMIKDKWGNKCAYCGEENNLTIDHVVPRSKGGTDFVTNVVCCCQDCNQDKSHKPWEEWYSNQEFFTQQRKDDILRWMNAENNTALYRYKPRKNIAY